MCMLSVCKYKTVQVQLRVCVCVCVFVSKNSFVVKTGLAGLGALMVTGMEGMVAGNGHT